MTAPMAAKLVEKGATGARSAATKETPAVGNARKKLTGNSSAARGRLAPTPAKRPESAPKRPEPKRDISHASNERRHGGHGRSGTGRRTKAPRSSAGTPKIGVLIAEWLLAVVLIVVTVPMSGSTKGYQATITSIMMRLTGLTGIFFALALIGTSQKAARFPVWFGLIIDLGIIYHASASGGLKGTVALFSGQSITGGTGQGGVQLAADFTDNSSQVKGADSGPILQPTGGGAV